MYKCLCHRYRITEGVNLPFRVLPTIKELGRTRMEVNVKVGDAYIDFKSLLIATTVFKTLIRHFRWRVSLGQKCLHLEWLLRFQFQNKQQKQVFRWHQARQSTVLLLTVWSGSKLFLSLHHDASTFEFYSSGKSFQLPFSYQFIHCFT